MGSIGLSFGSPTSGTGFDVTAMVAKIVANLDAAETPYQTQLTALQAQDTVISNLGNLMSTLSNDLTNLTDVTGVLSNLTGSSSNTNVLALTSAGTGAVAGSHSIVVSQLAQTSSVYAGAVAGTDTFTGSLSIQVGSGTAVSVSVDPANDTVSGLAASINAADIGVTASVVTGSGGEQLSLVSNTSGAAGAVTVDATGLTDSTTSGGVTFTVGQVAQDAEMTVDGIPASSSSNTVTNVLPGVTFQLLGTDTGSGSSPVEVQIANDTTSVATALTTFVSDYNAVVQALGAQEGKDASGNPEPLFGNPLVATLQGQLQSAISTSDADGSDLSTIGLSLNNDGTLALNSSTLATALTTNFSGVVNLFQSVSGFGETLATTATNLGTSQPDSLLTLAQGQQSSEESDINSTLTTMNATIATQTQEITASLNAANETLQLIPVQLQTVNELYSAITGYDNNG